MWRLTSVIAIVTRGAPCVHRPDLTSTVTHHDGNHYSLEKIYVLCMWQLKILRVTGAWGLAKCGRKSRTRQLQAWHHLFKRECATDEAYVWEGHEEEIQKGGQKEYSASCVRSEHAPWQLECVGVYACMFGGAIEFNLELGTYGSVFG